MSELTFGIEHSKAQFYIDVAMEKTKEIDSHLISVNRELDYLTKEKLAIESFLKYHHRQDERRKTLCGVFISDHEYGANLNTDSNVLISASARFEEIERRLTMYNNFKTRLESQKDFVNQNIILLENMKNSSPRAKIHEMGLPSYALS